MRKLVTLYWFLFLAALVIFVVQYKYVTARSPGFNIVSLELADAKKGTGILSQWQADKIDAYTKLDYARVNTLVDFLFIIGYTGILITLSYFLMQREKTVWLNNLLRWCFPLAILAGLLDVVENIFFLSNMYQYKAGKDYCSTMWISYAKFAFLNIILLIWLISLVNKQIMKK